MMKKQPFSPLSYLLSLLPQDFLTVWEHALSRAQIAPHSVTELRLRAAGVSSLTANGMHHPLSYTFRAEALSELLLRFCGNSLYAHKEELRMGAVALPYGIRVGIAGRGVYEHGIISGMHQPSSLVIRIPHRIPSCAAFARRVWDGLEGGRGLLIYAPPGGGKTTLLRELGISLATGVAPLQVSVIDSRGELMDAFSTQEGMWDVLSGYRKAEGIALATRVLCPQVILCDEIGGREESKAILEAQHSGVPLIATAHAGCAEDLCRRPSIRLLLEAEIFGALLGILPDANGKRSYTVTDPKVLLEKAPPFPPMCAEDAV